MGNAAVTNEQVTLSKSREYTLRGYLRLLEHAVPNGRYNHEVAQKRTAIRLMLRVNMDMQPDYEHETKALIRKLYAHIK